MYNYTYIYIYIYRILLIIDMDMIRSIWGFDCMLTNYNFNKPLNRFYKIKRKH